LYEREVFDCLPVFTGYIAFTAICVIDALDMKVAETNRRQRSFSEALKKTACAKDL
jgi:hypothetical protein